MPEPAGVTFDRARWLALAEAMRGHPLVEPLEAERLAAEFSAEERAAYKAASSGVSCWIYGSDTLGWFPRYPGRHHKAGPNGETVVVDPPRRSLGMGTDGRPIEVIATDPLPLAGVHGLLRRGVARTPEPLGSGVFGVMVVFDPSPFPWSVSEPEEGRDLGGAWLLDAKGGRVAWVPRSIDAHWIVRAVEAMRAAEADPWRVGALRDSLNRLREVAYPMDERSRPPPPEFAYLHREAVAAVERLLTALSGWVEIPPAPGAAPGSSAPPAARSGWLLWVIFGLIAAWALRGWW